MPSIHANLTNYDSSFDIELHYDSTYTIGTPVYVDNTGKATTRQTDNLISRLIGRIVSLDIYSKRPTIRLDNTYVASRCDRGIEIIPVPATPSLCTICGQTDCEHLRSSSESHANAYVDTFVYKEHLMITNLANDSIPIACDVNLNGISTTSIFLSPEATCILHSINAKSLKNLEWLSQTGVIRVEHLNPEAGKPSYPSPTVIIQALAMRTCIVKGTEFTFKPDFIYFILKSYLDETSVRQIYSLRNNLIFTYPSVAPEAKQIFKPSINKFEAILNLDNSEE